MSAALIVHRAGPGMTVQDFGRPGALRFGLSCGGAADRLALAEGAALLGQPEGLAALEMAALGGVFEATADLRIALTGAPMRAEIDGARVVWNACHALPKGARLSLGGAEAGVYGYLHVGGGLDVPSQMGARAAHLGAGIGGLVAAGDRLPVGRDPQPGRLGLTLTPAPRCEGGTVRVVPSLQTDFFTPEVRARFAATTFHRDARGNRMGARFLPEGGARFDSSAGLSVLSEVVLPGDIQITGDGTPFVLLAECQTTGGYPRIGSVLPSDLPRVVQCPPKAALRFQFLTADAGLAAERAAARARGALAGEVVPLVRRPEEIRDLLSYQLIGGVTAGDEV